MSTSVVNDRPDAGAPTFALFAPLVALLHVRYEQRVILSFDEVSAVIGRPLPVEAADPTWWRSFEDDSGWGGSGRVVLLDLSGNRLAFDRIEPRQAPLEESDSPTGGRTGESRRGRGLLALA